MPLPLSPQIGGCQSRTDKLDSCVRTHRRRHASKQPDNLSTGTAAMTRYTHTGREREGRDEGMGEGERQGGHW